MKYKLSEEDSKIIQYQYDAVMNKIYEAFSLEENFIARKQRILRDEKVKEQINNRPETYKVIPYEEIISDTKNKFIKNVSIEISPSSSIDLNQESTIFLIKNKLMEIYTEYNNSISDNDNQNPFLIWDKSIKIGKEDIKFTLSQGQDLYNVI